MRPFLCIAHRGASGEEPENTLRAIRRALALGARWVEVDVFAVEGRLVVFHDETLERTTDGRGRVLESSLAYLRGLDAGHGERIPFLEEILEAIRERAGINVELKGPGTGPLVVESLRRNSWPADHAIVSSTDASVLAEVKALAPELPLGLLLPKRTATGVEKARQLGAFSVHSSLRAVSPELIQQAHAAGLKVFVYTVNTVRTARRLRQMGADGVFTDFPDRILPLCGAAARPSLSAAFAAP